MRKEVLKKEERAGGKRKGETVSESKRGRSRKKERKYSTIRQLKVTGRTNICTNIHWVYISVFVISFLITWHHCLKKDLSKLVKAEMVLKMRNKLSVVRYFDYILVEVSINLWIQNQPVLKNKINP